MSCPTLGALPRHLSQPGKTPWDLRGFPGIWGREVGIWKEQAILSQGHFLGKWGDEWGWSVQETWLGFKVTTDLMTQPQKVWLCGHSGGC